jgi:hypothetical protein
VSRQRWRISGARITDDEVNARVARARADIAAILADVLDDDAGLARISTLHGQHEEADFEVADICASLNSLAAALASAADPASPAGGEIGPACTFMGTASMRTAALAAGLAGRQVSREDAARALRLIRHNLSEARTLLTERGREISPAQHGIGGYLDLLAQGQQQVEELTPRVMRLFADAAQAAPYQGVPG